MISLRNRQQEMRSKVHNRQHWEPPRYACSQSIDTCGIQTLYPPSHPRAMQYFMFARLLLLVLLYFLFSSLSLSPSYFGSSLPHVFFSSHISAAFILNCSTILISYFTSFSRRRRAETDRFLKITAELHYQSN